MSIFDDTHANNTQQLSIMLFIDVEKALNNQSLKGAAFMMDDAPNSEGEGTAALHSFVTPTQTVCWSVHLLNGNAHRTRLNCHENNDVILFIERIDFETTNVVILDPPSPIDKPPIRTTQATSYLCGRVADLCPATIKHSYRLLLTIQSKSHRFSTTRLTMASAALTVLRQHQHAA